MTDEKSNKSKCPVSHLTTAFGAPVVDNQNSMTAGKRGPVLVQDVWLNEKLANFVREVIPERRMHAKGSGAFGTFTVTNGGVFGSMLSTPIINPPQSAIMGMHNIVERPVAVNGKVEIRPIMYLALSYDHRIIDGKDSVGFLVKVKEMIEDPAKLLAGGFDPEQTVLGL